MTPLPGWLRVKRYDLSRQLLPVPGGGAAPPVALDPVEIKLLSSHNYNNEELTPQQSVKKWRWSAR